MGINTTSRWHERWQRVAGQIAERLTEAGLDGWVSVLVEVAHPLRLLFAQILWIAEPTFGKPFGDLAELLTDSEEEE